MKIKGKSTKDFSNLNFNLNKMASATSPKRLSGRKARTRGISFEIQMISEVVSKRLILMLTLMTQRKEDLLRRV